MFELYIGDAGEVLRTDSGGRRELPLFGLASAFLQTFRDLREIASPTRAIDAREAYAAQVRFNALVLKDTLTPPEVLWDNPYVPGGVGPFLPEPLWGELDICNRGAFWLVAESAALRFAISNWLSPRKDTARPGKYLSPRQLFLRATTQAPEGGDPFFSSLARVAEYAALHKIAGPLAAQHVWMIYLDELFRARTRQLGVELLVTEERGQPSLAHLYSSEGLIPFAWGEIMRAIDHGIYAHTCDICGGAFRLRRPFARAAYVCSPSCARKREIQRMGGREAFRAYNRAAQRRFAERRRRGEDKAKQAGSEKLAGHDEGAGAKGE